MALLHNRVSGKELKEKMLAETFTRTTISFYRYFFIENPQRFRDDLYKSLHAIQVFGRIYVAHEGINAQINVPDHELENFKKIIDSTSGL